MMVDIPIIMTCLTFPAMVSVSGEVSLLVMRLVMFRELIEKKESLLSHEKSRCTTKKCHQDLQGTEAT